MALPTAHREALHEFCQSKLVMTISLQDPCLSLYPSSVFKDIEKQLLQLSSTDRMELTTKQMILAHATNLELDANGRILVSPALRSHANLKKQVCVFWEGNKYSIWDNDAWQLHKTASLEDYRSNLESVSPALRNLSL